MKSKTSEGDAAAYKILESSNHGFIVINPSGIVLHTSPYVQELLGYDDLPGRNIKILLEEPLRSLHDGFLQRFVQTGNTRISGKFGRDVLGLSKSGQRVHMFLFLNDATRDNGDMCIVGQVERYNMALFR